MLHYYPQAYLKRTAARDEQAKGVEPRITSPGLYTMGVDLLPRTTASHASCRYLDSELFSDRK